ncbi:MAG: cytidylate kinase [Nitrospirales bacterium]|nr:MAG: cytidylate kinase [Nitrospirales bacterium]
MSTIIRKGQESRQRPESHVCRLLITIDGPAGVGKSTVAKKLAARLGYTYLDTGALYRGVAWKVRSSNIDPGNSDQVAELLSTTKLELAAHEHALSVLVDAQDVTHELRSLDVSQLASTVAALPQVRHWLLPIQRNFATEGGIVVEGRDMGTKVFPEADVKFFLDADPEIRFSRRYRELQTDDQRKNLDDVRREMTLRDDRDRSRDVSPLIPATDAMMIDTSNLSIDQVLDHLTEVVSARQ